MALDLSSLFRSRPAPPPPPRPPARGAVLTRMVTAGAGGARDAYLKHIEEQALAGNPALSWEDWLKTQNQQPGQQ